MLGTVGEYVAEKVAMGLLTGRSPRTIRSNLVSLVEFLGQPARADIPNVTRAQVARWIGASSGDPLRPNPSPNTVRSRLSSARSFFEWCVENELCDRNPCKGIRPPKPDDLPPRFLEADEVGLVLAKAESLRDRLVILLMVQMGLRRVEVNRANIEDIDSRNRRIGVRGKGHRGNVSRYSHIPDEAWETLVLHLRDLGEVSGPLIRPWHHKGRLGVDVLSKIVSDAMLAAGVKSSAYDGKSAHALRHTFGQHLIDDGAPIRIVQVAMGHKSVQTTELYTRREVDGIADIIEGRRYGGA